MGCKGCRSREADFNRLITEESKKKVLPFSDESLEKKRPPSNLNADGVKTWQNLKAANDPKAVKKRKWDQRQARIVARKARIAAREERIRKRNEGSAAQSAQDALKKKDN